MGNKKVVIIILEGVTDVITIGSILEELMEKSSELIPLVYHGDITSDKNVTPNTIKKKIGEFISNNSKRLKTFKNSDILEIIHIVDIDGTFVTNDMCIENPDYDCFFYSSDGIYHKNREKIIERNKKKSENINVLIGMSSLFKGKVPYRIFYFSQNIEHVLHNKLNLLEDVKISYAENFESKYVSEPSKFIDDFLVAPYSLKSEYLESWEYIKKDNNSLKRLSNLDILLRELRSNGNDLE